MLPAVEPELAGLGSDRLLADLQLVMEGAYNPNHPGALAHLDPPPLSASIVADLICAGLNNNLLAEELSPSLSRLERALCAWMAGRLGLPDGAGGVAASGGSLSNLMALVTARHQRGLACRGEAVVLCSEEAHVSLVKATAVMGLPPEALVQLPVTAAGTLEPQALEERLAQLDRAGTPVIAVVATAGTTVRGALDPLEPIAALCRRYGHWLHVDGAIGAIFAFSERFRPALKGLGLADSITVNPQKLLGITKTSSLLLLADPRHLQRAFATGLPYMEPSWGGGHQGRRGCRAPGPGRSSSSGWVCVSSASTAWPPSSTRPSSAARNWSSGCGPSGASASAAAPCTCSRSGPRAVKGRRRSAGVPPPGRPCWLNS